MKFNTLCVATLSAVMAGGVLAGSPYDIQTPVGLLVNESLDGFGYSRRNPAVGEIWELASPSMRVLQVVDGGMLVERGAFPTPDAKNFFVKTTRVYADGDALATGYYRAAGTISYKDRFGAQRTVYAFSELSASQQQEIWAFRQDKAATAAARRLAEAERRQRAEQTIEFKKSKERIAAEEAAPLTEEEKRERAEEALVEAFDALTDKWMESAPDGKGVTMEDVRQFAEQFRKLPKGRQDECLHRALNQVSDENVMLLAGILMDKTLDKEILETVYNDVLNRDESVKKPILQQIFKDREHPCWADTAWILDVTDELPKKE